MGRLVIVSWKAPVPDSSQARSRMVACTGLARRSSAVLEGGIELVPVGFAEDKHVDVPYWPLARLSLVPGRPRSVDIGRCDPVDVAQGFG